MNQLSFAIVTPSYAPDFERCRLLCQSIAQFVRPQINHYIIVDRQDFNLFRSLQGPYTHILTKEDLLPWWIKRLPVTNLWLSWKTLPVRGWLLQQLIKIAAARSIAEDVTIFVDSDVVFVRPFDAQQLVRGDRVRLYHEPGGNFADMPMHVKWHQAACDLLDLPPTPMPAPDYVEHLITWKRQHVVQLCEHLEARTGRSWFETLSNRWHLSEYILYGTFVDQVLNERSTHYRDAGKICHTYWSPQVLSEQELRRFMVTISPEHVAVMISAKAGMSVAHYQHLLNAVPNLDRV